MTIRNRKFGETPMGEVRIYFLENSLGTSIGILNYGGIIQSLVVRDRKGMERDLVLGYDTMEQYLTDTIYNGGIIGRNANRIRDGRFVIDGKSYQLSCNHNGHHLHGGHEGFDKKSWSVEEESDLQSIKLRLTSEDGDEGYPGRLEALVRYTLDNNNRLIIDYSATTNKATPVSFTNHSYFNLNGVGNGTISNHHLQINSDKILEVDDKLIPTGKFVQVKGTPFDFRQSVILQKYLANENPFFQHTNGYDHQFVLDNKDSYTDAEVFSLESGILLKMKTTAPGVQLYTANGIGGIKGKNNKQYLNHCAFCLEAQAHPDAPNHPHFPNTILYPGEKYYAQTVYHFSVIKQYHDFDNTLVTK